MKNLNLSTTTAHNYLPSVMETVKQIPEELLWKANFNSDNSIETYDKAIRSFLDFLGISSPEELRSVTHAHVIALNKYLDDAGHRDNKKGFLFLPVKHGAKTSDSERKLSRKTLDYLFKKYAKIAGIEGITPHSARATFITQALENNCPIEAVQKTVGHWV